MKIEFRDIMRRLHKLELMRHIYAQKITSSCGLYLGQLPVLEYIILHENCTQKEIADEMQITPASIAISTKRMQKAGLIERSIDENNMRCNKLFITEKGRELSEKCRKEFDRVDGQMFSGFSEDDIEQFKGFLDRVIDNISGEEFSGKSIFSLIELQKELDKKQRDLEEE